MKEIDFCPQAVTAEGPKIWGPTLEDLDGLDRFFNPHFIESGKIWGEGHAPPPFPPALASNVVVESRLCWFGLSI